MEYDYYPYDDEKTDDGRRFTFGKLLKYIGIAFVVLVYALIFFRISISNDTNIAKSFIWTEASVKAYNQNKTLSVYTQELESYTLTDENGNVTEVVSFDELSEDGFFKVSNFMYVKETKEVIITLRYNDTCEKTYADKYSIDTESGELFVFTLTGGGKRYSDYTFVSDERFTYHYRRLVFSGIDIENVSTLSLQGYCVGKPDYESPVCDMIVYDSHIPLSAVDLGDYLPAEINKDVKTPPYVKFED